MDLYLTGFVGLRLYFVAFEDVLDTLCVEVDVFVHVNEGKVVKRWNLLNKQRSTLGIA